MPKSRKQKPGPRPGGDAEMPSTVARSRSRLIRHHW